MVQLSRSNILHFIPALGGDCILIEFDNKECILIDSGYKSTYEQELKPLLLKLSKSGYKIKLFIVTHIDSDHLSGAIQLLEENGEYNNPQIIEINNIWYNGFFSTLFSNNVFEHHKVNTISKNQNKKMKVIQGQLEMQINKEEPLISAKQSKCFELLCANLGYPINHQFQRQIVRRKQNDSEMLNDNIVNLGDFVITVLSPNDFLIDKLAHEFNIELIKMFGKNYKINKNSTFWDLYEKLMILKMEEPTKTNTLIGTESEEIESWLGTSTMAPMNYVNQASIVVQIEYKDIKMLFTGDSDSDLWGKYLDSYYDIIKISHHGTLKPNVSIIQETKGNHVLVSTNGKKYGHPEKDLIANLALGDFKKLHFNYDLDIKDTLIKNQDKYNYEAIFKCKKIYLD
jgi:beta-lactamase superfamily II metal-dependent hydrolase